MYNYLIAYACPFMSNATIQFLFKNVEYTIDHKFGQSAKDLGDLLSFLDAGEPAACIIINIMFTGKS